MDNGDAGAVEGRASVPDPRFVAVEIAVVDADDVAGPGDVEADTVGGARDADAVRVGDGGADVDEVAAIGGERLAVRGEVEERRVTSGFEFVLGDGVVAVTLFPYFADVVADEDAARAADFRDVVRDVVAESAPENVSLVGGRRCSTRRG